MILLLFLINISFASDKNITCAFDQCSTDFIPALQAETDFESVIDLGQNQDNVNILLPNDSDPRNLSLISENNTITGISYNIDFSAKKKDTNAPHLVLISDFIENLNLNLNGFNGSAGEDASIICANRFKNGDYGIDAQNYFNNRRVNNQNVSLSRCDDQDVQFLQTTKFTCQNPNFILSEFQTTIFKRIKKKQKCIASSVRKKCLQKTMDLTCEWAARSPGYGVAPGKDFGGLPCPDQWRSAGDCAYDYNYSCWHSRDTGEIPPVGTDPAWTVETNMGQCSLPVYGGKFAYQHTREIPEGKYNEFASNNKIADLCNELPHPPTPYWFFNRISDVSVSSPSLDQDTLEPLPGSSWKIKLSNFFESCEKYYEPLNDIVESWISYGEVGNNCNDATVTDDVNNVLPWTKAGIEQDIAFGLDEILCSPDNCPANTNIQDINYSLDIIDPTAGANGTKQGSAVIIVYNIKNLTLNANDGTPGFGGKNDLPEIVENKYCIKKDDATTHDLSSDYAKDPTISFNIYKWKALDINQGQPSGQFPEPSNSNIKIYKKVDQSVRHLIKTEAY